MENRSPKLGEPVLRNNEHYLVQKVLGYRPGGVFVVNLLKDPKFHKASFIAVEKDIFVRYDQDGSLHANEDVDFTPEKTKIFDRSDVPHSEVTINTK